MLFTNNLDKIIFTRNELLLCDELVIISGYVGPHPVKALENLPIKSTVVYGMYGCDGIHRSLHNALTNTNNTSSKVSVRYSTIPIHAKCYIWKHKGEVRSALVGSANFSTNGLTTPFKEILADATVDTFDPLEKYISLVLGKSISCNDAIVSENKKRVINPAENTNPAVFDKEVCSMPLYIIEDGIPIVPAKSGINWGLASLDGSHVNINDAYIKISSELIEHYPDMFPQKQEFPSADTRVGREGHRHNDNIEILWDDGTTMTGLLEGSLRKTFNGKTELYPKQISTTPQKSTLGKYLRKRLGVKEGHRITYEDLVAYGRTTIDVSLQGDGIYYFDFSVQNLPQPTSHIGNLLATPVPIKTAAPRSTNASAAQVIPQISTKKASPIGDDTLKVGDKVIHTAFGNGHVVKFEDGRIEVAFAVGNKTLQYPQSVQNGFLKKAK